MFNESLLSEIRDRFHHVDSCPYQGPRVFFENAGGSLTLKSVVETNTRLASIPDNQGRDNPASHELVRIINQSREDMRTFLGVETGPVFSGESGTELLFRLVRAAILGSEKGGNVVGSTLEHPATVSAGKRWSKVAGKEYRAVLHDNFTATVTAEDYRLLVDADTRVATIIHTSPVTGMSVDIKAVAAVIRAVSPDCIIVVDGIQHAPHGDLDIDGYDIDAYTVSAYKVFSPRDTSAFACFSDVVNYLDWLGSNFTSSEQRRERVLAAGKAIKDQESHLVDVMINGNENQKGLREMPEVVVIGGHDNPHREGLVSLYVESIACADVVSQLNAAGVRTHVRKNDYFSGNILEPLNRPTCVRVSMCHYNNRREVLQFLQAIETIIASQPQLLSA